MIVSMVATTRFRSGRTDECHAFAVSIQRFATRGRDISQNAYR